MKFFFSILSIALLSILPFVSSLPMNNLVPGSSTALVPAGSSSGPVSALEVPETEISDVVMMKLPRDPYPRPAIIMGKVHDTSYALPIFTRDELHKYKGEDTYLPHNLLYGPYVVLSNTIFQLSKTSTPREQVAELPLRVMLKLFTYLKSRKIQIEDASGSPVIRTKEEESKKSASIRRYITAHILGSSPELRIGNVAQIKFPNTNKPRYCIIVAMSQLDSRVLYAIPLFRPSGNGRYRGVGSNQIGMKFNKHTRLYTELKQLSPGGVAGYFTHLGKNVFKITRDGQNPFRHEIPMDAMIDLLHYFHNNRNKYPILDLEATDLGVEAQDDLFHSIGAYITHNDPGSPQKITGRIGEVTILPVLPNNGLRYCIIVAMSELVPDMFYALPLYHFNEKGKNKGLDFKDIGEKVISEGTTRQTRLRIELHEFPPGETPHVTSIGTHVFAILRNGRQSLVRAIPENAMIDLLTHLKEETSTYQILGLEAIVLTELDAGHREFFRSINTYINGHNPSGSSSTSAPQVSNKQTNYLPPGYPPP